MSTSGAQPGIDSEGGVRLGIHSAFEEKSDPFLSANRVLLQRPENLVPVFGAYADREDDVVLVVFFFQNVCQRM